MARNTITRYGRGFLPTIPKYVQLAVKALEAEPKPMNVRQRLQQRDLWLHLDFNVAIAVVVVVTLLGYVVSKFMG